MLHRSDSHRLEDYLADETLRAEQGLGDVSEGDGKGGDFFVFFLCFCCVLCVRVRRGGGTACCCACAVRWFGGDQVYRLADELTSVLARQITAERFPVCGFTVVGFAASGVFRL